MFTILYIGKTQALKILCCLSSLEYSMMLVALQTVPELTYTQTDWQSNSLSADSLTSKFFSALCLTPQILPNFVFNSSWCCVSKKKNGFVNSRDSLSVENWELIDLEFLFVYCVLGFGGCGFRGLLFSRVFNVVVGLWGMAGKEKIFFWRSDRTDCIRIRLWHSKPLRLLPADGSGLVSWWKTTKHWRFLGCF